MPEQLAQTFRARLRAAEQKLTTIDESSSAEHYYPESWTRKQVLGHLLDSAANNHIRFVNAAIFGDYSGPKYAQNDWVKLHGYDELPWAVLLEQWRGNNAMLAQVVEHIPETQLASPCRIGDDAPVTLKFLIEDYLDHLEHHVGDIAK